MRKDYELIGGWSHGETVAVDESATRLESPVYEDENHLKEPFRSETYTKRRFAGEEFGDGYECYGLVDDDDTDTRELARMELHFP